MKKVELLSPVGNREMLEQAIHNGADAVYLAGSLYGARKFAKNFTNEELVEAISYAHLYGVFVYVTVNTLIYEQELDDVMAYVEFLHRSGVDAVIMQDMGLIYQVRRVYPHLEIHASTQCHNHNREIISLWKRLGLTRVVLARELSLGEIKEIDVDIEKEIFVYGALCVCYSGCCLFSSLNGGRSGNRGECTQCCRLPYQLLCNGKVLDTSGEYLLSTKELNTLNEVGKLIELGVDSFKIEGRMKSPYYVGYVTRLYRRLIDQYYQGIKGMPSFKEVENLKKLFNREFTSGYLFGDPDIMNISTSNHLGVVIGKVIQVDRDKIMIRLTGDGLRQNDGIRFQNSGQGMIVNRLYNEKRLLTSCVEAGRVCFLDNRFGVQIGEVLLKTVDNQLIQELEKMDKKRILVDMRVKCFLGKRLELEICDDKNCVTVYGEIVEKAMKREVTLEDINRQLRKLGNTPFGIRKLEIQKGKGIFVNLKALNDIRREAVEQLVKVRQHGEVCFEKNTDLEEGEQLEEENGFYLNVLVRNEEQLKCCLEEKVNAIYVTDYILYKKYKKYSNVYYRIDRVSSNDLEFQQERLLVGELGSVEKYHEHNLLVGDYYLNVTNHFSVEFLEKFDVKRVTLSVELSNNQIRDIMKKKYPVELVVYGRLELMVMKYCPLKKCLNYCSNCQKTQDKFCLRDRFGNEYPFIRKNCITHIMHYQNTNKINQIKEYQSMRIHHYRLELFDEDRKQVKMLISEVLKQLS